MRSKGSSSRWVFGMRNLIDKYFFLVGRILSTKPFHPEALKTVLQSAFNPVKGMDFKVIEDNRFLIRFNHVLNCNRDGFVDPGSATPFGTWLRAPPPSGPRARNDSHASIRVFPPSVVSSARRASPARSVDEEPPRRGSSIFGFTHDLPKRTVFIDPTPVSSPQASATISHPPNPPAPLDLTVQDEKQGGVDRLQWQIQNFRSALQSAGLHDLGFVGSPFTWCNNHAALTLYVFVLTVHAAIPYGRRCFPETTVTHLDSALSDHAPIIISTIGSVVTPTALSKPWRSEAHWLQGPECEEETRTSVRVTDPEIKRGPISLESRRKEADLRDKLDAWYARQELYWQQRRKIHWLRDGDRNTSFFHAKTSSQRRVNAIDRLRDEGGRWIVDPAALRRLIERHFSRVFDSDQPSTTEIERGMEHLACRIEALAQLFTKEEVARALFQMAPMKSPGPDGMPPLFFNIFGRRFKGMSFLLCYARSLNDTHIVLIPKCRKPESLSQCRPISLCNVLYKIASKSIANRIKPFLETIISPTQAVFVPGQLITDNILVAYELNHFMRNKNWGKMGHMALKLDISKAYDKVEWNFLKHVLLRLGFPPRFVDLIMLCVSSVRYSFLINGHEFGSLTPQRGLCQGDPLSPYLFSLCTEALSSLVGGLEHEGTLQGVSDLLANILGIRRVAQHDLYLGLPSIVGKSQKAVFSSLRDKVWNRISGRNEKMLSHAGKGMLIKAVLQSIPTYAMGVFRLPEGVLRDIQSLCADF
ncbi:UNVERIFIED_CONTAM: putative mitochondrial protein [Sesamum radiatum]|uniref:Mitochondrial protein n=1 Tax=Sesamum radiatum TaxID=300843 RepID=A0AAW2LEI7_SESRA